MELTAEQKIEKVKNLRPIDDVFFEVLARNPAVCQEMLRPLMSDPALIVVDSVVQSSERNLYGRSVRLDALCKLGTGALVNIEVQRSDNDDHLKRIRFCVACRANAASITLKESQSGTDFEKIPELYIIYISEFDFLHGGKTLYHVDKVLRETGEIIDDGEHTICVNTVVDDGTDIAELMSCFTKKLVTSGRFPILSNEVHMLKETEGGTKAMCDVMRHYEDIARNEGIQQATLQSLRNIMERLSLSASAAMEALGIPAAEQGMYLQMLENVR